MMAEQQTQKRFLVDGDKFRPLGFQKHQKTGYIPEGFFSLTQQGGHPCATFHSRTKLSTSVSIKSFEVGDEKLDKQSFRCQIILNDPGECYLKLSYQYADGQCVEKQHEVSSMMARELLDVCDSKVLEKNIYEAGYGDVVWQVEAYQGRLNGLILASPLSSLEGSPARPQWLQKDVSTDLRYQDRELSRRIPPNHYQPPPKTPRANVRVVAPKPR